MDLQTFFSQASDLSDGVGVQSFAKLWTPSLVKKGKFLVRQGEADTKEYILLDGRAIGHIHDPDGQAVCVGLYHGPTVITPNIARAKDKIALVSLEATTDVLVAQMENAQLLDLMITSESVRDWANGVLQDELARKADREWSLAALNGADRLAWFRDTYPRYEARFVHSHIASFLGVTPVTLSRLRGK